MRFLAFALVAFLPACMAAHSPMNGENVEEMCRREIVELHQFFEDWFTAALPNTDEAFARFADAMGPEFEMVSPDGVRTERAALLARLRAAHGFAREHGMRIWTKSERARALDDRHWIATYEEWQEIGEGARGRQSTAVFRRAEGKPNGLVWMHVHESWLNGQED